MLDVRIFYFFNDLAGRSGFLDWLIIFLASYFEYFFVVGFLLFLFFVRRSIREKIFIFLIVFGSAIVARLGVTEAIRYFYHHLRPFVSLSVHQLIPESGYSFPSGHAVFFFAMAAAVYFFNRKLSAVFFIAAFFVSLARVSAGVHYPSDILAGMLIGPVVAWLIFYLGKYVSGKNAKI